MKPAGGSIPAREQLALALLSGILLAAPFLRPALSWLHFVALVPWALLLARPAVRRAWLYFLPGAYAFWIMVWGPFSLFSKALPFALALLFVPFSLVFAVILRAIYQRFRWPLALLLPVTWVAAEWLRIRLSIGAIGAYPLGSGQFAQSALIQIADMSGVAGVSFVVAAVNGAIADLIVQRGRWSWRTLGGAAVVPVLLLAVLAYGLFREAHPVPVIAGPRVAVVQPNAIHYKDPSRAKATFEEQLQFTRAEVAPGSADLIAWPENAISDVLTDDPAYLAELAGLVREKRARMIVGAHSWASRLPPRQHTSAFYLAADGTLLGRYDKLYLIPWSEYVPFERWLPRLSAALAQALLGYVGRGLPGDDLGLFSIDDGGPASPRTVRFAVPICFEASSADFARRAAGHGADFLLNITSEGVFGAPVYTHMWALATLRAVENRVAIVRVGNNGISGFIEPSGRTQSVLRGKRTGRPFLEEGTLVDRVPVAERGGGTFYTHHGDWLAYLCVAGSLVLSGASFWARKRPSESSAAGRSSAP